MEPEETARTFKLKKSIYGGLFNDDGDILLCADGKDLRLPGGPVYVADVCPFIDEKWIPAFLYRKIEADTGIVASLIGGEIQPLAATYNTYSDNFREEHSAIIVGQVNPEQIVKESVSFFDVKDVIELNIDKRIKNSQRTLVIRMFASRDCPNSYNRKTAGTWLRVNT
jgi:hypothetical protein